MSWELEGGELSVFLIPATFRQTLPSLFAVANMRLKDENHCRSGT